MTPEKFREIAMSLGNESKDNEVVEGAHSNHPDFRVRGKIIASLGAPNMEWAMVKLPMAEQKALCSANPEVFVPCSGTWGKQGYTQIQLRKARVSQVRSALQLAVAKFNEKATSSPSRPKRASTPQGDLSSKESPPARSPQQRGTSTLEYRKQLDHPLKELIEEIRTYVLDLDPAIQEGLQWNSLSFRMGQWFATLQVRTHEHVMIVLHHGAKRIAKQCTRDHIVDVDQLLNWPADDRATICFCDERDFRQKRSAFKIILVQWLKVHRSLFPQGQPSPTPRKKKSSESE